MKSRILLLQTHTHAGKDYAPGDLLEVDDDQADWLNRIGVARTIRAVSDDSTDLSPEPVPVTGSSIPSKEKRR